jgi:Protein of unknown function (DUF2680)
MKEEHNMSKKKWLAGFLVIALALLVGSIGFAAVEQDRAKDFGALQQQMLELRKEMIKKHVEYGDITPEQAAIMEKRMTERYEQMKANDFKPFYGKGFGPGAGRRGGMMGGIGGSCPNWQNTQTPAAQ